MTSNDNGTLANGGHVFQGLGSNPGNLRATPRLMFASRGLQFPPYLGLIVAQAVYVLFFWIELLHLIEATYGHGTMVQALPGGKLKETALTLVVLGMMDVMMISNLLIM